MLANLHQWKVGELLAKFSLPNSFKLTKYQLCSAFDSGKRDRESEKDMSKHSFGKS